MKYFSAVLLIFAFLFVGCGDGTDVEARSDHVSVTTADGTSYNFSGDIIAQWESYSLEYDDEIEVENVYVEVDGLQYSTNWSWSREIGDLSYNDINDEETYIPFSFSISIPKSSHERNCVLHYTLSLDGDHNHEAIGCVLPTK